MGLTQFGTGDLVSVNNSVLRGEIAMVRHGVGDAESLIASLRDSVLYVPTSSDTALMAGDWGGVRWIYGFTTEQELADFFLARGEGDDEVAYMTIRGDRLLDVALPAMEVPGGIAVDVAGEQPLVFPGVVGVVPEHQAFDRGIET
jgi:hypothetical protein